MNKEREIEIELERDGEREERETERDTERQRGRGERGLTKTGRQFLFLVTVIHGNSVPLLDPCIRYNLIY